MKTTDAGYLPVVAAVIFLAACSSGGNGKSGAVAGNRQAEAGDGPAVIRFDTLEHDFGTIREGEMVVYYFDYTNEGEGPLVLRGVEATCGCTTPDWSKEPLPPGKSGRIKVVFDASNRSGSQNKTVTVRSNADNPVVRLKIKAIVGER